MKQIAWLFAVAVLGGSSTETIVGQSGASAAPVAAMLHPAISADIDLSAINPTINACQNFYQHACGGFINATAVTPDHPEISLTDQKFDSNRCGANTS